MNRQNSAPVVGSERQDRLKRSLSAGRPWWKRVMKRRHHSQPIDVKKAKVRVAKRSGTQSGILDNYDFSNNRARPSMPEFKDPETQMYDLAMTCLCFQCEKCLNAIRTYSAVPKSEQNQEEIEFETTYLMYND
eukprot:NODE_520_length_7308_cov_0.176862.p4 type:complete len:133 gc:universal NODE_520_length_7308_cov_0.176862:3907-4305(+)